MAYLSRVAVESDPDTFQRRIDLAHAAAQELDKAHLIKYDRKSGTFQVIHPPLCLFVHFTSSV